jgi:uncharacterized membrane protein
MSARTARTCVAAWPALILVIAIAGCGDQRDEAASRLVGPSFAKTSTAPSVTSANPAWANQGTVNLNVTISGSGFDRGSTARWYLDGVPYGKIVVNSTSYVSASQLVANISVASDADIDDYDIVVTTSSLKQGIGSDLFVVTLAVPIPVVGYGINMAGQVVGPLTGKKNATSALWDPQIGVVPLPNADYVVGIDENARTISGHDPSGFPAIWTSTSGAAGPWTEVLLPMPPGGGGGTARGLASDAQGNAVFVGGAALTPHRVPAVWTKTPSGWQVRVNSIPDSVISAWVQSINSKGQGAGMSGSGCCFAVYWDSVGVGTTLAPLPGSSQAAAWSINGDGTVIVGDSNGSAVMWTRTLTDGVYGPWSGAIALENTSDYCGNTGSFAKAVNAAGTIIVGDSCKLPVAWFVSGGTVTRFLLGTLGPPNSGQALSINNLQNPNAAGGLTPNGSGAGYANGAFWRNF